MLLIVYFIILTITFITSLFIWRRKGDKHLKILSVLLGLSVVTEIYGIFLFRKWGHISNNPVYNVYMLIAFLLIAWYYRTILTRPFIRKTINFFLVLFPLIWIGTQLYIFNWNKWNSYVAITGAVFTVMAAVFQYYELFNAEKLVHLSSSAEFWIATGMLLFYAANLPYLGALNFIIRHYDKKIGDSLNVILQILNILMYSFFTYSYVCRYKTSIKN